MTTTLLKPSEYWELKERANKELSEISTEMSNKQQEYNSLDVSNKSDFKKSKKLQDELDELKEFQALRQSQFDKQIYETGMNVLESTRALYEQTESKRDALIKKLEKSLQEAGQASQEIHDLHQSYMEDFDSNYGDVFSDLNRNYKLWERKIEKPYNWVMNIKHGAHTDLIRFYNSDSYAEKLNLRNKK